MFKILFMLVLVFLADSLSQRVIHPTWRPPPRRPIVIRTARSLSDGEPLWLYRGDNIERAPATGDHPYLPKILDDIKLDPNRRYARSVDSRSARRSSGSRFSSGSHDTGPTHPGYNRRNARSVHMSGTIGTPDRGSQIFRPRYQPSPTVPIKPKPFYTYAPFLMRLNLSQYELCESTEEEGEVMQYLNSRNLKRGAEGKATTNKLKLIYLYIILLLIDIAIYIIRRN